MHISTQKIDVFELYIQAKNAASGAIVMFSGDVRNLNKGTEVLDIDYEAYVPCAEKTIAAILADAHNKWDLQTAICVHRIGKVEICETAVAVFTSSAHRKEAYAANRYIIDRVKQEAPIWKHEFFADGTSEYGTNCDCAEHHDHSEK
jgi:molybdopterin synthase catalytic subunit